MAPSGILTGVAALVSCFNDDGANVTETIEKLVKQHGGSVVKRISSATHLIWRHGEPRVLAEAKEMHKKVSPVRG